MPRKTIITKEEFPSDPPENAALPAPPPDDADLPNIGDPEDPNSIEAFLSRIGNDAVIKIFQKNVNGKTVFRGEISPEYCNEEYIQTNYGPGDYSLKALVGGRYVIGGSRQLSVGPPSAEKKKKDAEEPEPLPTAPLGFAAPMDPATMQMEMMREEMRMQRDLMMKLIEKSGNPPPAMDLASVISAVAGLARMFTPAPTPPVNPLTNVESVMNLISKGIEIGQTGSVEPKKEGVMGWIKDLGPVIGDVISSLRPANGGGPAPSRANVQAVDPKQVQAAPEAESSMMLRAGIAYLKKKALSGADAGLYIDFIGDNMADPQWTPLIGMIHKPYDEVASTLDPELLQMPYRPWFESLFNGIRDMVAQASKQGEEPNEPTDQPSAGATGDGDNA